MLEQLIPLATGGLGGLLGGNAAGSMFRKTGVGAGSSSIVGMIAGAAATYFFGPTMGPMQLVVRCRRWRWGRTSARCGQVDDVQVVPCPFGRV